MIDDSRVIHMHSDAEELDKHLRAAAAIADDIRTAAGDMIDEGMGFHVSLKDRNHIHAAQTFANAVITHLNAIKEQP